MRRAARVDDNHEAIVTAFRKMGCTVLSLAPMGRGVPDLLVACKACTFLVEVKDGSKSLSRRVLTEDQKQFHAIWPGHIAIVDHVENVPDAIVAACHYDWHAIA